MLKYFLQMQSQQKKVKKLVVLVLSFTLIFVSSIVILSAQFLTQKKPTPHSTYTSSSPVLNSSQSARAAVSSSTNHSLQMLTGSFFSEESLIVTKESDGLMPGTLRAVLLQASGLRSKNPFVTVKITFDPSLKKVFLKKNLASIREGLIHLDCGKAIIDGSQIENTSLEAGEQVMGLHLKSSGNIIRNCQFSGFNGYAIFIEGNRNQILNNKFGDTPPPSGATNNPLANLGISENLRPNNVALFLSNDASENTIDSNEFIGNQEAISFAANVGNANRLSANTFQDQHKSISTNENPYKTSKIILKQVRKENESYLLTAQIPEKSDVEIYLADANGKEGKTLLMPATAFEAGEANFALSSKDLQAGLSRLIALSTHAGKNTSEFSESLLIPAEVETPVTPPLPVAVENPAPTPAAPANLPAASVPIETFLKEMKNDHKDVAEGEEIKILDRSTKPINERADAALSVGTRPAHSQLPADGNLIPQAPIAAPPPAYDPYLSAMAPPMGNMPAPAAPAPLPTPLPAPAPTVTPNANTIDVQRNAQPSLPADSITLNLGGIP